METTPRRSSIIQMSASTHNAPTAIQRCSDPSLYDWYQTRRRSDATELKVLLANKFFFENGGSEVVMFQERAFLLNSGVEVVDFSMKDDRNAQSPYSNAFVDNQTYSEPLPAPRRLQSALRFIHANKPFKSSEN